jgi:hypothetical protein
MRLVASLVGMVGLVACAPAQFAGQAPTASSAAQCFRAESVRTYALAGRNSLVAYRSRAEAYRLDLLAPCVDLEWAREVAFRGRGGQTFVCSPLDAELIVPRESGPAETCLISDMRRIPPEEAARLAPGPVRFFRPWRPERRWPPLLRRPRLIPETAGPTPPLVGDP